MNREQKILALKNLLAGKPVNEAFPVIDIALLPVKKIRPNLLVFVCGKTSYELRKEIRNDFPVVKAGHEKQFEDKLKQRYPNNKIDVRYGITEEEFDSIYERLEIEY